MPASRAGIEGDASTRTLEYGFFVRDQLIDGPADAACSRWFASIALEEWAYGPAVKLDFNGARKTLRKQLHREFQTDAPGEHLNLTQFLSLEDTHAKIEARRN